MSSLDKLDRPTVHYTKLPHSQPDDVLYQEWETYLRELPRLLSEGREGQAILIKGEKIIGFFESDEAASDHGTKLFLLQPFLVQKIREHEPVYRIRR
jgi:hypothetical protein